MIVREMPYTNLHDLNIDWILKIVKDFKDRYQNLDETFQNMLQQIITAGENAVEAINNNKETALEAIRVFMEQCVQALNTETTNHISEIQNVTNNQLDAINAAGTNQIGLIDQDGSAKLSAISSAGTAQVNIINGLITSLPQTYEDSVNQLQIINAVLNQTYNYPPLVQGHYADANESDSKTLVADNYRVSTLLSSGCASKKIRIQVTNVNGIIRDIIYWTGWGSEAVAHTVSVSTSSSDEKTLYTYTFPATATYFTIVFATDYNMTTQLLVSDLQVSLQWQFTALESIELYEHGFDINNTNALEFVKPGNTNLTIEEGSEIDEIDVAGGSKSVATSHKLKDSNARENIDEINNTLNLTTNNILTTQERIANHIGYPTPEPISTYDYFKFVPVTENTEYILNFTSRFITLFDSNKSNPSTIENQTTFTPTVNGYAHISIGHSVPNYSNPKMCSSPQTLVETLDYNTYFISNKLYAQKISSGVVSENNIIVTEAVNVFTTEGAVVGIMESNGSINPAATSYKTTAYFKVNSGVKYTIKRIRAFLAFDNSKTKINGTFVDGFRTDYEYTPENDGYIRFSYIATDESTEYIHIYRPSNGKKVSEGIELSSLQKTEVENICDDKINEIDVDSKIKFNFLRGKKYYASGDSYTEWSDGKYPAGHSMEGQTVTYDREIRKRNNMSGYNIAVSGSTMALSNDGTASIDIDAFSNTKYQSIPADTDYLTLAYGINDATYCDLGEKGDTTNVTFWGAWDTVLKWFASNRPAMKIGIIIFQRVNNSFYTAVKEIAKYYGIPYIDFYGGDNTPMYVDGKSYDVNTSLKTSRKNYFCGHEHSSETSETFQGVTVTTRIVEANPTHPGFRAHIDESTIIEEFLRRL